MVVVVVPHDPGWSERFLDEANEIKAAFAAIPLVLHHIGSTAIPGILAKPVIDLLGEVRRLADLDAIPSAAVDLGYEPMGAYGIEGRRYFRKNDGQGQRTHHLHVFEKGSSHIERHLAFRDYLTAFPEIAAEYSALKARLMSGDDPSWDRYQEGKNPFVRATERDAVEWYRQVRLS